MTPWITQPVPFNIGQGAGVTTPSAPSLLWENTGTGNWEYVNWLNIGNIIGANTAVVGKTITSIVIQLRETGTVPTQTITSYLWNSGSNPDAPDFTGSTMSSASLTSSFAEYTFDFTGVDVTTSGTIVGVGMPTGVVDGSNRIDFERSSGGSVDNSNNYVGDTSSWINKTPCMTMDIYGT